MDGPTPSSSAVQQLAGIARARMDSTSQPGRSVEDLAEALGALVRAQASPAQLVECVTSWVTTTCAAVRTCWFQPLSELQAVHDWGLPGQVWRVDVEDGRLSGIGVWGRHRQIGSLIIWTDRDRRHPELRSVVPRAGVWLASALITLGDDRVEPDHLERLRHELVTTVSHEVRTPLTVLSGGLELLLDGDVGELDPAQRRLLSTMQSCAARLTDLADNVVELVHRDEEDRLEPHARIPLDVAEQLDEQLQTWHDATPDVPDIPGSVSGRIELDVAAGTLVVVDPDDFARMMRRVLENPLAFAPDSLPVRVSATTENGHAVIRVQDQGPGIPRDEVSRLGTPFFRTRESRRREVQGAGLGLSVVRTLADRNGGTLSASSTVGEGTTVQLRLPAPR